jgi:hypothetical protein
VVISGSSSGDALRITQTGTGNALLVEDSTNPDSTPFVVDASGNVGIGTSSPAYKLDVSAAAARIIGPTNYSGLVLGTASANGNARNWIIASNFNAYGDFVLVQSNALGGDPVAAGTTRLTLDSSGNLGLGVTPSAWYSTVKAYQFSTSGALWGLSGQQNVLFSNNEYLNGSAASTYIATGYASRYQQIDGLHRWYTAPSGFGYGTVATSLTSTQNGNSYTIVSAGTTDFTLIGAANNNVGTTFTKSGGTGTGTGTVSQNITFTQAMTLDASGNLGIGNTSPQYQLDLNKTGSITLFGAGINAENDSGDIALKLTSWGNSGGRTGSIRFITGSSTSGSERARIDSSGNLGVGTTSPSVRLDIQVSTGAATVKVGNGTLSGGALLNLQGASGSKTWFVGSNYNVGGGLEFTQSTANGGSTIGSTPSMVIDSSGDLLVGYTTSNGAYKLQVNSQIFATSATIATSDGRYKENVTSLTGALDIVKALNPVQFTWKQHPIHNFDRSCPTVGFIAQEVQQVLADKPYLNSIIKKNECEIEPAQYETVVLNPAVDEVKDDEGNIIVEAKEAVTEQRLLKEAVKEDFYGIAEGNMIAILTKALQESTARIEQLEAKVAALEGTQP